MKKLKINLLVSVIYQLFAIIYGFVLPRLILEQFGSDTNGLLQSITQFLGIIGFMDMGVGQVIRSSLYKPLAKHDDPQLSRIMVAGSRFYRKIAYALLAYVVIISMVYPALVNVGFDWIFTTGLIVIMSISSFAQYYFGIAQEQLLHADQKSYLSYSVQIICYIVNMAVCVCLIRLDCSIHAIKLATALIFLIKPIFYTFYIRKKYKINWEISYTEEPLKQKWHGVAQHISSVVLDGTDNVVLTIFSTLSNVSIYSVYYLVVGSLSNFYQATVVGIQSAAGTVWARQNQREIRNMFSWVEMCLHFVTIFVFCCAGLLIVPFVQVYTDGLTDANYIQPIFAIILVLAYGIRCLRTPYNIWILAAGHFKQAQKCHIIAAVMNLTISALAVVRWGLIGVAIGTLIAMCYQTLWIMIYTTKHLIKHNISNVIKQLLADFVAVILVCVLASGMTLNNISYIAWFIMAVKVSLVAFTCIAIVVCVFYLQEIKRLVLYLKCKLLKK